MNVIGKGSLIQVIMLVLGQFKTFLIMLGGCLFFNYNPEISSLSGAIVALSGMTFYTYLNLRAPQDHAAATKQLLKQVSFAHKAKPTVDGEKSDTLIIVDPILESNLKETA